MADKKEMIRVKTLNVEVKNEKYFAEVNINNEEVYIWIDHKADDYFEVRIKDGKVAVEFRGKSEVNNE